MEPAVAAKAAALRTFLLTKVAPDIDNATTVRDAVAAEVAAYAEFSAQLAKLPAGPLHTLVDLGENVLCSAVVDDTSRVFLHCGLGFHPQLSRSDAAKLAAARIALLQGRLALREKELATLQTKAELLRQGLAQLVKLHGA